jgi:hypothetical protein
MVNRGSLTPKECYDSYEQDTTGIIADNLNTGAHAPCSKGEENGRNGRD